MNIIEKLEALRTLDVDDEGDIWRDKNGRYILYDDLRAIIDEFKSTQEPDTFSINIKVPTKYRESTPITHPQLSDETVKDAARYRYLREGPDPHNGTPFVCIYHIGFTQWTGEKCDEKVDEAMKVANAETEATKG